MKHLFLLNYTKISKGLLSILLLSSVFISDLEAREWSEIKKSGVLKVATRTTSNKVLYNTTSKTHSGFTYEMVKDFADLHGLQLELTLVSSFSDYWNQNENIYDKVDLAADIFTVTPQREALIHMSPFIENVEILYGKHGKNITSYQDLVGQRVLTYEHMSFPKILKTELEKQNIPYTITYVKEVEGSVAIPKGYQVSKDKVNLYMFPKGQRSNSKLSYYHIVKDYADVGINDGISVIAVIFNDHKYKDTLRPYFPAQAEKTKLSWGSSKNTPKLNKEIEKFIKLDRENGNFSKRLKKYIGLNLQEYMDLISMIK